jgi:hypothetical protein
MQLADSERGMTGCLSTDRQTLTDRQTSSYIHRDVHVTTSNNLLVNKLDINLVYQNVYETKQAWGKGSQHIRRTLPLSLTSSSVTSLLFNLGISTLLHRLCNGDQYNRQRKRLASTMWTLPPHCTRMYMMIANLLKIFILVFIQSSYYVSIT